MNNSTSYNTLQSVLQTYHDNYALPNAEVIKRKCSGTRTPKEPRRRLKRKDLAQAMLEHNISDVVARIASGTLNTNTGWGQIVFRRKFHDACCCYCRVLKKRAKWRA